MSSEEEKLAEEQVVRVLEARPLDTGKGIAKLDPDIAEELNISTGDAIEVRSQDHSKRTAALIKKGFPDDRGKGIIRLDGVTRRNIRVAIGEEVKIRKIEPEIATMIIFFPTKPLRISGGAIFIRRVLENRVMTTGDLIEVPLMNSKLVFKVMKHVPASSAVIITEQTEIILSDRVVDLEDNGITPIEFVRKLKAELDSFLEQNPIKASRTLYKGKTLHERLKNTVYQFELTPEGVHGRKIADADETMKVSVFEETMRIFGRLTRMTNYLFVPLKDLLDDGEDDEKVAFYRLLLAEISKKVPFPFKYYPLSGNFEGRKDVRSRVIAIEHARAVMTGACPHCTEQLTEKQVKKYEEGENVKCKKCGQIIAQKWYIDSEGILK
ncbi:MAG: hypothetical protein ACFFD4_09630 [Candidatus Odinarchaeota archaeon]